MKFLTHNCEIWLYGESQIAQCNNQTQTRCSACHQWCCSLHRHDLKNGLKKRVTLCHECLEQEDEIETDTTQA